MTLQLIPFVALIFSAAAAPADTSGFQFDFSSIFGTAAAQGTKGSAFAQDESRSSLTGLGRVTFGESMGRSGAIRPLGSNGDLNAIVNAGSSAFNTPTGGASSSTWGRAETSGTNGGVYAAEIGSKSGTLNAFGNGAASFSYGRGGGGGSTSIVETLSKSFQNIFGSGSSGKATGELNGVGASQGNINGGSQAHHKGLGGIASAMAMANAGGTTDNGQKANFFSQHQTFSNDYMSASSSQSRSSLLG